MADQQIDVKIVADASSVKPQTDQVAHSLAAVGDAAADTSGGVASLAAEIRQAIGEVVALRQSVAEATPALAGTGASASQSKEALASLVSELSGVASSFADGVNPMAIFAQHGIQTIAAIAGLTRGGAGLAAFLGGPWGAALTAAASIAANFAIQLWDSEGAGNAAARGYDAAKGAADNYAIAVRNLSNVRQSDVATLMTEISKRTYEIGKLRNDIATSPGTRAGAQERQAAQRQIDELASLNERDQMLIKAFEMRSNAQRKLHAPTGKTKAAESRVSGWDADLAEQKLALQEQSEADGSFRAMSLQAEHGYWAKILAGENLTKDEKLSIRQKTAALSTAIRKTEFDAHVASLVKDLDTAKGHGAERLRIANQIAAETKAKYGEESTAYKAAQDRIVQIAKEIAEQRRQIEARTADIVRQMRETDRAGQESAARFRVQMGIDTTDQLLAKQEELEQARHEEQTAPLEAEAKILDGKGKNADPTELARLHELNAQLEAAQMQHQQKMTELERQRELERTQIRRQAIASTASLWSQNIAQLVTMQQSFSATLHNLYQGMVNIVSTALAQVLQKWITTELSKTAAALTGSGQRIAAETTAGTATTGISALSAIKQVAHSAAVAAARVYASIAQIPIVGPILAPAAAAAALYGVIRLGKAIFSAKGGIGAVPYDDAPFLLHRNEMVLPANLASPLRAMLQGGSAANGNAPFAANDGGGPSFHYNDYTEKGQSDAQIMAKRMVFAKAMRQAYREGAFAGTPLAF